MKTKQFCSVCKQWLDMEIVSTSDGDDDDGVIWFRCPQCQGFLPKLKGSEPSDSSNEEAGTDKKSGVEDTAPSTDGSTGNGDELQWDSPADFLSAEKKSATDSKPIDRKPKWTHDDSDVTIGDPVSKEEPKETEPVLEYAAMLGSLDPESAVPYRPWETYDVGQCIFHLAWNDCGVVVAKEVLPGGRQVIKAYFEEAGVVRLIEKAPR